MAGREQAEPDLTGWAFRGHDPKSPEAVAAWLGLERALALIDAALPVPGLLVKGSALALTVYASPLDRPMSDIDVVIAERDVQGVTRALVDAGFREVDIDRPITKTSFETKLMAPTLAMSVLVELHSALDKVVGRPIDYAAILDRSAPAPGMRRLRVPATEDHVLLVVLHLAVDDFRHRTAFVDLARLLEQGADLRVCLERAERWKLTSALQLSLELLDGLRPGLVPAWVLDGARARGRVRRRLQHQLFSDPKGERVLGIPWMLRQTALRDDLAHWALGLGVYGAKRVAERALTRWRRSPSSG